MENNNINVENVVVTQPADESAKNATIVKEAKKLFSNLGFRMLIATAILYAVCYGLQYVGELLLDKFNPALLEKIYTDYTVNLIYSMGIQYAFAMPLMALVIAVKCPAKAPEKRRIGFGWWLAFFVMAYSLMYSSNLLGTALNSLISGIFGFNISTYSVQTIIQNANIWVVTICTVIFAPLVEELIFRKLLIDRCGRYGEAASALLSGITFGLFHGNLTQGIYAFCLGYFLALIYSKSGKIRATIGIHMVINFMGSFIPMTILKLIDIDELLAIESEGIEAMTEYVMSHMTGILVLGLYGMLIMALVIAGMILMIVNRRKIFPRRGEIALPKHTTFSVVMGNPGMILFVVASVGYIVYTFIRGLI